MKYIPTIMTSKYILYRNKFIADLVLKYSKLHLNNILDIGCGEGILNNYISATNIIKYTGLDKKLRLDQITHPNIYKKCNVLNNDELIKVTNNEKYNIIVLQEILEHLPLPDIKYSIPLLIKIKSLLQSEGTIIISVPNINRLTNINIITNKDIKSRMVAILNWHFCISF